MKTFKKSYKILSLVLALCMMASFLPTVSFAAITYQTSYTGSKTLKVSSAADNFAITTEAGSGGKLSDDTVYVYNPTASHSGQNYLNLSASNLTGSVVEFGFLLEDDNSILSFMGGFINQTGYDNYLETGKMDTTSGNGHYTATENIIKFTSGGVKIANSDVIGSSMKDKTIVSSLETGVWHTAAIKTPGITNGAGEDEFVLYLDGVEYIIPTTEVYYGSRHIRLFGTGEKRLDNLMVYKSDALSDPADYKNYSLVPALSGASDAFVLEDNTITLYDSVMVGDLKDALSGADIIRVYSDDTYTTELSDSDSVSAGNKVVAISKNNTDIERGYSYYSVDTFTYDETGLCDGSTDFSITSGTDNTTPATLTKDVAGVYGKAAEDKVYKIEATGKCHTGFNFAEGEGYTLDTSIYEFSVALKDDFRLDLAGTFYKTAAVADNIEVDGETVTNRIGGTLVAIDGSNVKIGSSDAVDSSVRYTSLLSNSVGKWVNIAVVIPGSLESGEPTEEVYVYVNGVKTTVALSTPIYGTRHLRLAPSGTFTDTKTAYYDNIRAYLGSNESYDAQKDAQPTVNFGTLKVSDNTILTDEGITVGDFKEKITTSATIRVFEDNTYAKELSDTDELPFGAMVVFAATNRRTTERTYSYYTTGEMTYEEPNLYEGTKDFSVSVGSGNNYPAEITKVGSVYGKADDDLAYKIDVVYGTSGANYFGSNCETLDTRVMEISFALPLENASPLTVASANYTSAVAEDNITVDGETVTNRVSGTLLNISSSAIVTSSHSALASESQNKKLCDITPGQWINLAIVLPGYNQLGEPANEYLIYVNGTEYKLPLATPTYGTRHLRFAPNGTFTETKTVYYDNIRQYNSSDELYDAAKDKQPAVDLSAVDVLDGNINVADGTTVADFKDMVSTKGAIRVFENENYNAQLEDTDEMKGGNMVVFAASNNRTTERTYSYYTVNRPLFVQNIKLTNADGKAIRGTQSDIANVGETYYLEATITNKAVSTSASLKAIAASYDEDGKMVDFAEADVTAAPGVTKIDADTNAVTFKDVQTPKGGTLKAFLWLEKNNEPLCQEFNVVFDGAEEYHILAFSNSYGNDSFRYLPSIGKAAGIDIYAVNMYTGGCTLAKHYGYMNGSGTYNKRIEYTPDGTIETADVSFQDGLYTYGYSWDYITLQSRSVQSYDFDYYYTESTPYITALADYIREGSPKSEVLFFQTWAIDTDTAKSSSAMYDESEGITLANAVADMEDTEIRPFLFSTIKANYKKAAEMIGNPNRMVPVGEAVNYAVGTLGFPEWTKNEDGSYNSSGSGRGMYRDTTCHLATCGQVLDALTWYEYLTGHDARENPYQVSGISEEDMALLKEAAHWACSQADYIPAN